MISRRNLLFAAIGASVASVVTACGGARPAQSLGVTTIPLYPILEEGQFGVVGPAPALDDRIMGGSDHGGPWDDPTHESYLIPDIVLPHPTRPGDHLILRGFGARAGEIGVVAAPDWAESIAGSLWYAYWHDVSPDEQELVIRRMLVMGMPPGMVLSGPEMYTLDFPVNDPSGFGYDVREYTTEYETWFRKYIAISHYEDLAPDDERRGWFPAGIGPSVAPFVWYAMMNATKAFGDPEQRVSAWIARMA